jgi:glutamate mutase epsilon subunit
MGLLVYPVAMCYIARQDKTIQYNTIQYNTVPHNKQNNTTLKTTRSMRNYKNQQHIFYTLKTQKRVEGR